MTYSPVRTSSILVLALGNDICGDDAVGFLAAQELRTRFGDVVDVAETGEAGLALLEFLEGYQKVLLLDSAFTQAVPVGTVLNLTPDHFREVKAPSPHYAGLPEVMELARRLQIEFPEEFKILAMEVEDPYTITEELTATVQQALPNFVEQAAAVVELWLSLGQNPAMNC